MKNPLEQVVKYGSTVWSNVAMDELRKTECLCLNCANIEDCYIAKFFHDECETYDIAMMVTRCMRFINKAEEEG